MHVPFLDLQAQARELGAALPEAVGAVLESQQCILGPTLERFESAMAEYHGVRHAIGVGSGTDALALALAALEPPPGGLVVTPAFTFFATASTIVRAGARPVFVDVDPATMNLDPAAVAAVLRLVGDDVVGMVPVHLYGRLAPMDELGDVAARAGLWMLEDAAQAVGARTTKLAGTLGRAGCLSFYPTKNLGGIGDGGMVLTDDDDLAIRIRRDRHQGMVAPYVHESIGLCSRLDAVQAAALLVKLRFLDGWNARRREVAARYTSLLAEAGLAGADGPVIPPGPAGEAHVFHQYVIRARDRDALAAHLADGGVGTQVYYPIPLHRQPALAAHAVVPLPLRHTEAAAGEVLALPIYPQLTEEQVATVVGCIASFYGR